MPRKKITKAKTQDLKELSGPKFEVTCDMSESEIQEQLAIFLKDYDFKAQSTIQKFNNIYERSRNAIRAASTGIIAQIPEELQSMTFEEFIVAGGTFEAALCQKRTQGLESMRAGLGPLPSIMEDPTKVETAVPQTRRRGRPRAPQSAAPPTTKSTRASRANNQPFATPANSGTGRGMLGMTPFSTPKFDTTLKVPLTNARRIKPGEIGMSADGSPLQGDTQTVSTDTSAVAKDMAGPFSKFAGVDLSPSTVELMLRAYAFRTISTMEED